MQCNCGNSSGKSAGASTRTENGTWLLDYTLCSSCGRAGSEQLHYQPNGSTPQRIAQGLDARALYLDIERGIYPESSEPEAPTETLEQKLVSLLTTGPDAAQWSTPDPDKKLTVERGRHYLICHAGDWEIRVLYFSWVYACSWHVFVPLIDYRRTSGPSDIEITFEAQARIVATLEQVLGINITTTGITCAPPAHHPVQIRNRITGEAIGPEHATPTIAPTPADTTKFQQCALL